MALTDAFATEDQLDPPNEVLLNVIRQSEKRGLGTSAIVIDVDLEHDAVRDRLHGLEAEGRVESETIGSEDDYDFVWYLADNERTKPVDPEIDRLVRWCEWTKDTGDVVLDTAKQIGLAGLAIVMLSLTAAAESLTLGGVNPSFLLIIGWATVIGAAGAGAAGGGLIYASGVAEWVGKRLVDRD